MDLTSLPNILASLVGGGLTVPATSYVINWLGPRIKTPLTKNQKRVISFVVAAVIMVAAFLLQVRLGYAPAPTSPAAWFEQVTPFFFAAWTVSQGVLSAWKRGKAEPDEEMRILPVEDEPEPGA
jgi:hypothetical protein